jgi:hypothetical protein
MPKEQWNHPMYIRSGNPETENESTLHYPGMLGKKVVLTQPHRTAAGVEEGRIKEYQFIWTDSSMTVTPFKGAVAWWADRAAYQVTTSPTALGRGRVAGVFQNAVTAGNYGFIQTAGPATVKIVDAPTAAPTVAGLIAIPSATAGKADVLAAGTAATYPALGVTASAVDGGTSEAVVELDVQDAG